jgi:UDP:flavonoid glycosyltransferase YjiC (YdhE family)
LKADWRVGKLPGLFGPGFKFSTFTTKDLAMRILFTSTGGTGHLQPLLPYAAALVQLGHDVRVAAPISVAATLEKAGLVHIVLDNPHGDAVKGVMGRMDAASADAAMQIAIQEVFYGLQACAVLPGMQAAIRDWRPDLVVREASEPAGAIAAEAAGIPHARVDVHNPEVEAMFVRLGAGPVNALRVMAGLPTDGGAALRAEPVFTAFPAALDSTSPQRPPFRVRTDAPKAAIADDKVPFVYITFGTIAGRLPKSQAAFRTALAAVADLQVQALLTLGPVMPRAELGTIPANVTVETYVPQAEVWPKTSAVLCHGGAGTVLGALAAGVPLVVAPMFADQPANARSVDAAGAGIAVVDGTADALRTALQSVLTEPAYRLKARQIADEIAGLNSIEAAADAMLGMVAPAQI